MIIIIDGYNLLKQIFPGAKKNLEKQKQLFIQQLAFYKSKKGKSIAQIIVVFDAGPSTHAIRTVKSDIVIVYSGIKNSADDWIIDFVERNKNQELLVITLDRHLRETCQKLGADWLSVHDFYQILQENLLEEASGSDFYANTQVDLFKHKYTSPDLEEFDESGVNKKALDLLIEQASSYVPEEKLLDKKAEPAYKKGQAHTQTKTEKRLQAKIKKIQ